MNQKFEILFGSLFFYSLWLSSFKMFSMSRQQLDKLIQVIEHKVKARWVSSLKVADTIFENSANLLHAIKTRSG